MRGGEIEKKSKIRIKIEQKVNFKVKKIVLNEFNLCCKGGYPRIYENSIFPAYVPEKNKIITPWFAHENFKMFPFFGRFLTKCMLVRSR